jgi:hypothetical protein
LCIDSGTLGFDSSLSNATLALPNIDAPRRVEHEVYPSTAEPIGDGSRAEPNLATGFSVYGSSGPMTEYHRLAMNRYPAAFG